MEWNLEEDMWGGRDVGRKEESEGRREGRRGKERSEEVREIKG